jgi:hypothetical protein
MNHKTQYIKHKHRVFLILFFFILNIFRNQVKIKSNDVFRKEYIKKNIFHLKFMKKNFSLVVKLNLKKGYFSTNISSKKSEKS